MYKLTMTYANQETWPILFHATNDAIAENQAKNYAQQYQTWGNNNPITSYTLSKIERRFILSHLC